MMDRQSEFNHAPRSAEVGRVEPDTAQALREQVSRRLAGGARAVKIEVCHDSRTVTLTGVVHSFYAKQVLYQLCRRCTPGFRVIDATVVGTLPVQ